ncbi:hypothetical protein [Labedella phragmitis]|uniref:hypothetical protein n=1 Tax=Labedella phragmitis TaxID=2498849 RepID=UPI001408B22B|nr:hypothetical protein [Labedella phragmitis]
MMALDAIDGRMEPLATRAAPIVGAARAAPTTGAHLETVSAAASAIATVAAHATATVVLPANMTDVLAVIATVVLPANVTDALRVIATGVHTPTAADVRRLLLGPREMAAVPAPPLVVEPTAVTASLGALGRASDSHGRLIVREAAPPRAVTVAADARVPPAVTAAIRGATVGGTGRRTTATIALAAHPVRLAPTATRVDPVRLAPTANGRHVLLVTADRDARPRAPAGNGRHDLRATANGAAVVVRALAVVTPGVRHTATVVAPGGVDLSVTTARSATTGSSVSSPRRSSSSANSGRSVRGTTTRRFRRTSKHGTSTRSLVTS